MKYPKLKNIKELIINPDATPKIDWVGSGERMDLNQLESLAQDIRKIKNNLPHTKDGKRQFDQFTAELLGNKLKIEPVVAADAEFWQLFTTIYALDIVLWRWNKDNIQLLPKDRITGNKWKDTFKRLWFRSFLTKENYYVLFNTNKLAAIKKMFEYFDKCISNNENKKREEKIGNKNIINSSNNMIYILNRKRDLFNYMQDNLLDVLEEINDEYIY